MQLLGPALFGVQVAEEQHEKGSKLFLLVACSRFSCACLVEDCCCLMFGARRRMTVGETVIGESSSLRVEEIMALLQGVQQGRERIDIHIAGFLEKRNPRIELDRFVHLQGPVRTKGGINSEILLTAINALMTAQVIARVVGGAYRADKKLSQNPLRAERPTRQQGIRVTPDRWSSTFIKEIIDFEITLQLQMGPLIKRIAKGEGNGTGPGQKGFVRRCVASAIALGNSVRPHHSPFIMVALQPYLRQVAKPPVLCDICRRQV